jgi:hypothetical protein
LKAAERARPMLLGAYFGKLLTRSSPSLAG